MELAPIALFAYKRPQHTLRALEALSQCDLADESRLVVFCDGPKRPEDVDAVRQVREVVRSRPWCGTVEVIERERNAGLANSVVTGVSDLCREYGRVIVLEDDLVVSPYFLRYMNDALEKYKDEERVMQISGYMFNVALAADSDAVFLPFTTSWGWATWKRAWEKFDPSMSAYEAMKKDKKLRFAFNFDGNFDYFSMLEKKYTGQLDSWAIVWYASVFIHKGLVLHPLKTLVRNDGFDGSGTNCGRLRNNFEIFSDYNENSKLPNVISESLLKNKIYINVIGVSSRCIVKRIKIKILRLFIR